MAENADEDGNYDWKDNEQPDIVEQDRGKPSGVRITPREGAKLGTR